MNNVLRAAFLSAALITSAISTASAAGQENGVVGYWREPEGSVIHVDRCGHDVCATLVAISRSAPARVDGKNPDPGLRQRSLCGLQIGTGFHLTSPNRAEGGTLYDPKTGKSYHGTMTARADGLDLRGYIGISVFGRTEHWTRTSRVALCSATAP